MSTLLTILQLNFDFIQLYFEQNYLAELDRVLLSQIRSYGVDVVVSNDGERLAVFRAYEKNDLIEMKIPKLPEFNWEINKDYLKTQIMLAEYFIS